MSKIEKTSGCIVSDLINRGYISDNLIKSHIDKEHNKAPIPGFSKIPPSTYHQRIRRNPNS